jgi:Mg2+ and Co2+ transporter CorA
VNAGAPSRADAPSSELTSLPRSIFVPQEDPRREAREAVDAILSDAFMGFLSLLLLPIILIPFFVTLPSTINQLFDAANWTIIAFFIVEYGAKIYLADDRVAFARSPWHLLDLTVIVLSVVSYLPILGLAGHGSAILLVRLLRLPRAFAVAGRAAGSRYAQPETGPVAPPPEIPPTIHQVDPSHVAEPRVLSWDEFEAHLDSDAVEWIHLSNVSQASLVRLSTTLRLPEHRLRLRQLEDLPPHIGRVERTTLLFLQTGEIQYPKRSQEFYTVARRGAVIILQGPKVLSVSPHDMDPFDAVERALTSSAPGPTDFRLRVVSALLDETLRDYRRIFEEIELEIAAISRTPRSRLPKDFLLRVYEIHKSILRLSANTVRLRELLQRLVSGRLSLEGLDEPAKAQFEGLTDEMSYLSDIAKETSDNLQTVVDIYTNQSSFETNRILKILAVITAVAIIPATIGGLLGIDGPYDFVLWQVLLEVTLGMAFVTYCFIKLGWLRV